MKIVSPVTRVILALGLFVSLFAAGFAQAKVNAKSFNLSSFDDGTFLAKLFSGDFQLQRIIASENAPSQNNANASDRLIFGNSGSFEPRAANLSLKSGSNASLFASFVVNSNGDESDVNPGDNICLTLAATCTLRAAIEEANGDVIADADSITFDPGVTSVSPLSPLPAITQQLTINGNTTATARVVINGSLINSPNINGLELVSGSAGSIFKNDCCT